MHPCCVMSQQHGTHGRCAFPSMAPWPARRTPPLVRGARRNVFAELGSRSQTLGIPRDGKQTTFQKRAKEYKTSIDPCSRVKSTMHVPRSFGSDDRLQAVLLPLLIKCRVAVRRRCRCIRGLRWLLRHRVFRLLRSVHSAQVTGEFDS